jgi:hypothetical protein
MLDSGTQVQQMARKVTSSNHSKLQPFGLSGQEAGCTRPRKNNKMNSRGETTGVLRRWG